MCLSISQCLVCKHNSPLFPCALPPRSSSASVRAQWTLVSVQLPQAVHSLFSPPTLACLFIYESSCLLPSSRLFHLFRVLTEVARVRVVIVVLNVLAGENVLKI